MPSNASQTFGSRIRSQERIRSGPVSKFGGCAAMLAVAKCVVRLPKSGGI
jgi:hypothetical protein